jgi:hypothetical protein
MDWKEFIKMLNVAWKIDRKNQNFRYNNIYTVLNELHHDENNIIPSLKAFYNSEIQLLSLLTLFAAIFSIGTGFISSYLGDALKNKDIINVAVYSLLLIFDLSVIASVTFYLMKALKKYKFILCVVEDFEKRKTHPTE